MKLIGPTHRPHPDKVTRSLLRVTVSKDGGGHDFACGRPSRWRALRKARAPQDEDFRCPRRTGAREDGHIV